MAYQDRLYKIRLIYKGEYEQYGLALPASIGLKWSGADVKIEDLGGTLVIQKVNRVKREIFNP